MLSGVCEQHVLEAGMYSSIKVNVCVVTGGLTDRVTLQELLKAFVTYHRFISFSMYCGGFVGFVFSLVKKHYLKQFTLVSITSEI